MNQKEPSKEVVGAVDVGVVGLVADVAPCPRRRLRLRKWSITASIAGFMLLAAGGIVVGVLVSNNSNSQRNAASLQQQQKNQAVQQEQNDPIVLKQDTAPEGEATTTVSPTITATTTPENDATSAPLSTPSPSTVPPTNDTSPPSPIAIATTSAPANPAVRPSAVTVTLTATPTSAPSVSSVKLVTTNAPAAATIQNPPLPASDPNIVTFYVHGDIPYETDQAVILDQQMREVPDDAEFVVFVGDMRDAHPDLVCVQEEYEEIAALFSLSRAPTFVLLGDNDWSDCPNQEEGLQLWSNEFIGFESKHWTHSFDIKRQDNYPDNFAFVHKDILFLGLRLIGGDVHDSVEWRTRLTAESEWTIGHIRTYVASRSTVGRVVLFGHANPNERHGSFFNPLTAFIQDELQNSIPIVYICGDKHEWLLEPNYKNQASWLRVMVTGLGAEPLLKVTIESNGMNVDPQQAFALDRRL